MGNNTLENIEEEIGCQYPNINIWMKAMKHTPKNKMVCHSFIREYVFKNFDIKGFCEGFAKFLEKEGDRIENEPLELYQEFIIKTFLETNNLLIGKPLKKAKLPVKVCYCLCAYKFYKSIMSEGDEALGPRERSMLKKKRAFRLMIENKLTIDDISTWKGELKGAGDIIWFTKYDSIPPKYKKCSDNPKAGQRIRNLLGLAHLFDDGLIEVQIPKDLVEKGSKVPTICEAAGYPYFRPAKRKDGFGRTIDLDNKSTGLPEGVHPKINWESNFGVRYVGDLDKGKKEFSDSEWREVTSKSEADLIAFIEGLKDEA